MSKIQSALTLDEAIRLIPEVIERLDRIEALLSRQVITPYLQKAVYDWHDLKAQGIGEREAYAILRRYCGTKVKGRRQRITHDQLMDYYKSREQ